MRERSISIKRKKCIEKERKRSHLTEKDKKRGESKRDLTKERMIERERERKRTQSHSRRDRKGSTQER